MAPRSLAVAIVLLAAGCQLVLGTKEKELVVAADDAAPPEEDATSPGVEAGSTEAATAEDAGVEAEAGPLVCPTTGVHGPNLVKIPDGKGGIMCIDATEVSMKQYAEFLAGTNGGTNTAGLQPTECSFNADFKPYDLCLTGLYPGPFVCTDASCQNRPQVCVHWCDAYAYCTWAGKRLCGKIGGGQSPTDSFTDPTVSAWMNACTSGGKHFYTYGDEFKDAGACVASGPPPSDVGTNPGCQSPEAAYAGVFDLNGNVFEWEDSCAGIAGVGDRCRLRGGSFLGGTSQTLGRCDDRRIDDRAANNQPDYGIRCCWP